MPLTSRAAAPLYSGYLIPLAWTSFVLWGTFPALQAHLASIAGLSPLTSAQLISICAGLGLATAVYVLWLRRRTWRLEPRIAAGLFIAPVVILQPVAAVVTVAIVSAAFVCGSLILRRTGLSLPGSSAGLAFPAILGLAVFTVILFVLGTAGLLNSWLLGLGIATTLALGRRSIRIASQSLGEIDQAWRDCGVLSRPWAGVCFLFCAAVSALAEAVVLTPSIAFDAMHFHLPLIKTYSIVGNLIEYPQLLNEYAYNPQNFEILLTLARILGGDPASQLLAAALAALALLMTVGICRLAGLSVPSILLGLAAVAGMPMAVWSASVMKNDFAMACFETAAIYACLKPVRDGSSRWFLLSGALLGAAFGVKPTALFAAVPIGLIWLWDCFQRPDRMRLLTLTGICFAATAFIWPARTYVLTGDAFLSTPPSSAIGALDPTDPQGPLNHLGRYVEIAVDAHLRGDRGIFEAPIRSPFGIMAALLLGGVLLLGRHRSDPVAIRAAAIAFGSLLYWISTMRTARYGITPILLTPFLLAPGFSAMLNELSSKMRVITSAVLVYGLAFSLSPTLIISNSLPQLRNLAGLLSNDDYVELSFRYHKAFRSLEGIATQEDEVLAVGSCGVGSAPFPWKVTCCSGPWMQCPPEKVREMAKDYDFVILPKRTDPATLGEAWSLVVAPEGSRAAVYPSPGRKSGSHDE